MTEEIEIKAYGRVQGVSFRHTVKRKADKERIVGVVLNRIDGSVEIVAQGERSILQEFLKWVQAGPGLSNITGLHYHWRKPSREFLAFTVIRDGSFLRDQARSFLNLGKTFIRARGRAPLHVAIIPDGNRRWARKKGVEPEFGHYTAASFQHMKELFSEAQKHGVQYLTLWGFSTENWKRNAVERNALFDLLLKGVAQFRAEAAINEIRFRHIGRKDRLPRELIEALECLERETAKYTRFNVQLCLDYGGTDEIVRAVNALLHAGIREVDETTFESYLDAHDVPPVDLIIRTSGEQRLSGFMPLKSAYAELFFSDVHFPDFDAREFRKALEDYGKRERRFGGDKK